MKILITGVAGFIGSNLCHFFLENKDEVVGIDNFLTGTKKNIEGLLKNSHFRFFKADLLEFDFNLLKNKDFDVIFHLASPASPNQYKKYPIETLMVNSLGTKRLLDFIKNKKTVFVLASTSEIYGNPKLHPQKENYWGNVNPVGTRACYDEGKRFGEALTISYFRKFKLDLRIARIFNTYGPNMEKNDGRAISNFITQALSDKPLTVYGDGSQTRSFCYISDLVKGLFLLAIKKGLAGEIVNLGNPDERKIIEVAKIIKKLTKTRSPIVFQEKSPDDPEKRKPSIEKATKLLSWKPKIKLEDGLKKTIDYFKKRFF